MASWGPKLYQDDIAQSIREQFKDLLKRGYTSEEITKHLVENYEFELQDSDDVPVFWFALADVQWELGRLLPEVKKNAIEYIDKGTDQSRWLVEDPKGAKMRIKVLEELKNKLEMPMPSEKKITQYRLYKCEWEIGDVYAYLLDSEHAKEKGVYGRYFLLHKIGETVWWPGHIVPIVRIKITKDAQLPLYKEAFNELEYVQTFITLYQDRFLPIDSSKSYEEQIAEKSKIKYEMDEAGFLPQFRMVLINTSKRAIPKKLVYLGNFKNVVPPSKEFVPHSELNIPSIKWNSFEETIINRYCGYNLGHFSIYSMRSKR